MLDADREEDLIGDAGSSGRHFQDDLTVVKGANRSKVFLRLEELFAVEVSQPELAKIF